MDSSTPNTIPFSGDVEAAGVLGALPRGRRPLSEACQGRTDNAMRIVTGRPGSGKSAILSRLVSMSRIPYDGSLRSDEVAPIDLAVHAKGKSVADVTARLAKVLDVEPKTEAIFGAFKRRSKPLRIVVDALDESTQPTVLATELLRPLNSIDSREAARRNALQPTRGTRRSRSDRYRRLGVRGPRRHRGLR